MKILRELKNEEIAKIRETIANIEKELDISFPPLIRQFYTTFSLDNSLLDDYLITNQNLDFQFIKKAHFTAEDDFCALEKFYNLHELHIFDLEYPNNEDKVVIKEFNIFSLGHSSGGELYVGISGDNSDKIYHLDFDSNYPCMICLADDIFSFFADVLIIEFNDNVGEKIYQQGLSKYYTKKDKKVKIKTGFTNELLVEVERVSKQKLNLYDLDTFTKKLQEIEKELCRLLEINQKEKTISIKLSGGLLDHETIERLSQKSLKFTAAANASILDLFVSNMKVEIQAFNKLDNHVKLKIWLQNLFIKLITNPYQYLNITKQGYLIIEENFWQFIFAFTIQDKDIIIFEVYHKEQIKNFL